MVLALGASRGNRRQAVKLFQRWHPGTRPSSMTIVRTYETLKENGAFSTKRHKSSVLGEEVERDILSKFSADPQTSVRSVGAEAGVSKSSVWRIVKKRQLHPYHVQLHQALEPRDFQNRMDFANWILIKTEEDPGFVNKVLWTDEANFSRNAQVNIHNAHYWSDKNPHWVWQARHQYQWSFNVWCGIYDGTIIGPVFFDGTLTGERYVNDILNGPLQDFLCEIPLARIKDIWYQHDGAPAHGSSKVCSWLDEVFPQQWIGRHGPIAWPARSPDFNPLDFFLWGYVKTQVYQAPTTTSGDLKEKIRQVCNSIPETMVKNVTENLVKRCQSCIAADGHLFEHVL